MGEACNSASPLVSLMHVICISQTSRGEEDEGHNAVMIKQYFNNKNDYDQTQSQIQYSEV